MEQERIMNAFQRVADANGVTLETVMEEIEQLIALGTSSRDRVVRARWEAIPHQGSRPTVTELICHLVEQVKAER